MINEVVEDYLNAIKKSIIDYILMDPTERDRLSVYIKYKNPHLYGEPQPYTIMPKNNNSLYAKNLLPLEAILLKNSPYFVAIQRIWL